MMKPRIFSGRIVFDHLQKTAGQAVNAWLTKALGSGCVTPNLNHARHADLINKYGGKYSIISGHMDFEGHGLDPRYQYITCLREPLDRAISWIYFTRNNPSSSKIDILSEQIDRFIASRGEDFGAELRGHISNPYVEHFAMISSTTPRSQEQKLSEAMSAVEQYDVCGFYEEMQGFLADVAALIGVTVPKQFERVNITHTRPTVAQVSPLLLKRLEEVNAFDLEFYRLMRERRRQSENRRAAVALPESSLWEPYNPEVWDLELSTSGFTMLSAGLEGDDTLTADQVLCLYVEFSLGVPIECLEIGIHIFDEDRRWAFGTNTTLLGRQLRQLEPGTHRAHYYLVAGLPEGKYTAGFAFIEMSAEGHRTLAWYDNLVSFRVNVPRLTPCAGYVSLPVEFSCWQTSDTAYKQIEDAAGTLRSDAVQGGVGVVVGEAFDLPVRLENNSAQPWATSLSNPIYLSYRAMDEQGNPVRFDGARTPLSEAKVSPGQTLAMKMHVVAPSAPGRYRLVLAPMQKLFWFDEKGFTPGMLELDVVQHGAERHYDAADIRLFSQIGRREGRTLISNGQEGFLLFGPYAHVLAGSYTACIEGSAECAVRKSWVDVACDNGTRILAKQDMLFESSRDWQMSVPFELVEAVFDLEVRVWVADNELLRLHRICLRPSQSRAVLEPRQKIDEEAERCAESITTVPNQHHRGGRGKKRLRKKLNKSI